MADRSFHCPECDNIQSCDSRLAGKQIICKDCLEMIDVPEHLDNAVTGISAGSPSELDQLSSVPEPVSDPPDFQSDTVRRELLHFYNIFNGHWACYSSIVMFFFAALCVLIILAPVFSGNWIAGRRGVAEVIAASGFAAIGLILLVYGLFVLRRSRAGMPGSIAELERENGLTHSASLSLMLENFQVLVPALEYCLGSNLNQRFSSLSALERFFMDSRTAVFHRYNCLEQSKMIFQRQFKRRQAIIERFMVVVWGDEGRTALRQKFVDTLADIERSASRIIAARLRECSSKKMLPVACPECENDIFDFHVEYKLFNGDTKHCAFGDFPFRHVSFPDQADGKYRGPGSSSDDYGRPGRGKFCINDYIVECRNCKTRW